MDEIRALEEKMFSKPTDVEGWGRPVPLNEFLAMDIPPVEYWIEPFLPKHGKVMVSASSNVGKSMFVMNLALAMTCNIPLLFEEKFKVTPARVLYIDLEMGKSPMKDRFLKMCKTKNLSTDSLFVKHLPCANLLEDDHCNSLRQCIAEAKADVVILDPLGHAWSGDENSGDQVAKFTAKMNEVIAECKVSFLIVHHWRKAKKEAKEGGEMAAGSYKWTAWLDSHICLKGEDSNNITVSCEKSRHTIRFKPWIAGLDESTLWLEHKTDYGTQRDMKLPAEKFRWLYETAKVQQGDHLGLIDGVPLVVIAKVAKEHKICSRDTIDRFVLANPKEYHISQSSGRGGRGHSKVVKFVGPSLGGVALPGEAGNLSKEEMRGLDEND